MLETRAVVVHADKIFTLVQANQVNGCSACEGKGCGSGKLTQLFCSKPRQFKVENHINANVGDEVIVAVPDGAVLHGIGLVYLLPLTLMFVGVLLVDTCCKGGQQDAYMALGALLGLVAGFAFARWLSTRQAGRKNQPYIARLFRE